MTFLLRNPLQRVDIALRIIAPDDHVFYGEQSDGYREPISRASREADEFFNALGADIRHGGGRAFYKSSTDHIQMPPFEVFRNTVADH